MAKYIAFHRAINVSGTKIIKMEYLRQLYADMGFKNIASYIQTGNVYFETAKSKNESLAKRIEKHLYKELGFEVETMVRTVDELASIADNDPYKDIEDDGNAVVYVGFLSQEPEADKQELLLSYNNKADECTIVGTELFILRYRNKGKPRFDNKFMEGKLKVICTTRNRKTVFKLLDLYR